MKLANILKIIEEWIEAKKFRELIMTVKIKF